MTTPGGVPSSAQRLFATAFYAPIGFGARLVEDLPHNLGKARQTVSNARTMGKLAVRYGTKEMQKRLEAGGTDGATRRPVSDTASATGDESGISEALRGSSNIAPTPSTPIVDTEPVDPGGADDGVAVNDLALPDYDHLAAAHIIGKLQGLTAQERQDIGLYEAANRGRRTVLGKLTQLDT